jgi:diguanylate cyclase (GGDEF)-like protein
MAVKAEVQRKSAGADSDRLLQLLLAESRELILVTDGEGRITRNSAAAQTLLLAQGAGQHDLFSLMPEADDVALQRTLAEKGEWRGEATLHDGRSYRITAQQLVAKGSTLWLIAPLDGGEERVSHFDRLTGLPDQHLFMDRARQTFYSAQRQQQSVAMLALGVDNFARINDGLGHGAGDRILQQLGGRLREAVRSSDTVARIAGDQFAFVLTLTEADHAVVVAHKLQAAVQTPFEVSGQRVTLSVSIGITVYPDDGRQPDRLLKQAESAMRHGKKLGGNHYQFYASEMNSKARRRIELENQLRAALYNEEFLLHYQPKVDVESGAIVGAEALVRWQHPERGLLPPGEFIPVAEESGLISPLGAWVLREACRQNRQWQQQGLPPVRISVNMAAPQFCDRDIVVQVAAILSETGLEPQLLELEITENLLIGDIEAIEEKLKGFRDLGLQIAIDDFGTGYSSLSYLSRFPITTLKIDRAFVHDLEHNQNTAEIARAIIGLSLGLQLNVVAEGAETIEHVTFLKEQGCDTVQGFFYSRPLPAERFASLLARGYIGKG